MSDKKDPILRAPLLGQKAEAVYEDDGVTVKPQSSLANEPGEFEQENRNPDYFPSTGEKIEDSDKVGKGANPAADVVTKNNTTVDPVFIEPSPTADGETVPLTAPASLPEGTQLYAPSGEEYQVGEQPEGYHSKDTVLVHGKNNAEALRDGDAENVVIEPAKVVPADEAPTEEEKVEADRAAPVDSNADDAVPVAKAARKAKANK